MRRLSKYFAYARAEFIRGFRYRANYWATVVGTVCLVVIQWYLWHAVYTDRELIAGLSLESVLAYTLIGRVTSGFLMAPDAALRIGSRVRLGTIVHDLVKPVDFHDQLFWQSLGKAGFQLVATGMPLLAAMAVIGILRFPPLGRFLTFLVSMLMAYVTLFATSFLSGVLTFYTKTGVGVDYVYTVISLLSGEFLPLEFFPGWLRTIANALPFKSMYYVPMAIWSGIARPAEVMPSMVSQCLWTLGMVAISKIAWSGAIKSLTVQGG
jgi:ABC-2 type transport system permease protein